MRRVISNKYKAIKKSKNANKNNSNNDNSSKRIMALIGIIIVSIYLLGTVIFSYIALPGTYLNGKDISYASKEAALASAKDDFGLEVTGRDGRSLNIKPSDIDYKEELPPKAKIDQNPFAWPVTFATGRREFYDFEYKTFYNEDKLNRLISESQLMNQVTEPQNARVAFKNGQFVIEDEVEGNKVDQSKLKKEIINAINTKKDKVSLDDSFYIKPEITKDSQELKDSIEDNNKIANMNIKFNFNGFDLGLSGESLLDLFDMTDSGFELNYEKVREYVKYLANETNTYGTQRKFNATGIGQVIVGPGVYGFKLDQDKMVDKIFEMINLRESGEIEPVYSNVGFSRYADGGDIGDTYIELDLSRQHMWFYKNGSLFLESDVVSGLPEEKWASNVGVGSILHKVEDTTLKGLEFDEENEYETEVDYWIPTGWDGEGFHDAPWRSAFGGDIYLKNGSHGCYNLPPEVAKELFENVDYLTPVVVYESSTNYSPAMAY